MPPDLLSTTMLNPMPHSSFSQAPLRWVLAQALLAASALLVGCAQTAPAPQAPAAVPVPVPVPAVNVERTAEPDLQAPERIVLHVHTSLVDKRFLPLLQTALARNLVAPVLLRDNSMDLAKARPQPDEPLDADLLPGLLAQQADWAGEPGTYHVLLMPDDMRGAHARYPFAMSHGDAQSPYRATVVSLARLQALTRISDIDVAPQRTADRTFKMIARSMARSAGLTDSERCLFGATRTLRELDETAARFCEPDAALLVRSGILKAGAPVVGRP